MPRAKRNTPFQPGHGLFYGLRPVSRDPETNTVTSVACRFCEKFGREEKVGAKRRATQHVKHFKQPFRTENYHQHHLGQHPTRWTEYQVLPADRKAAYLALDHEPHDPYTQIDNVVNAAVSESQCLPSRTRHPLQRSLPTLQMSSSSTPLKFLIERPIIDKIIADILFDPSASSISKDQAVAAFATAQESMADYIVTIPNPYIFNLVVHQVATGATPEGASKVISETIANGTTTSPGQPNSFFGDCSLPSVFAYLRSVCAFNLQSLSDLAKAAWGFTISFRRICHKNSYFVEVLVRLAISGTLKSFHLLALPSPDRSNWETSYANLTRTLDVVVHDRWREKMIGISTDGFEMAEGGTHIIVDRLAQETSRSIYRTWSAANRISAVVKTVYSSVLDLAFFDTLTQLTAYFRRQKGFTSEKDYPCLTFALTNWQSLETTLKWFKKYRMAMLRHLQEKKPACSPSMSWWILAMAVLEFTQAVSKTYHRVRGIAGVSHPLPELTELVKTLNRLSGCKGPVTDNELSMLRDWDLIVDNKFVVQKSAVRMFLSGLGTFVHVAMDGLSPTALDEIVKKVGAMFLAGTVRFTEVITERENGYHCPSYLPSILPHELVRLSRASFNECVRSQAGRLAITTDPVEIEAIEDEFGELVEAYHREETFKDLLNLTSNSKSFRDAWGNIKYKFRRLHRFCGVIATVFPETIVDEDPASIFPLECDVFRESSKDFIVEASLHCPQYKSLKSLSKGLQTGAP